MKLISIRTQKNTHLIKDGVLSVKGESLVPVKAQDGRMILRYYFDCKISIPNGVIGLIMPPNTLSNKSLYHSGSYILLPGENENPYIEYKINTDAIPVVLEQDDYCASILFFKSIGDSDSDQVGFNTVIEPKVEEEKQSELNDSMTAAIEPTGEMYPGSQPENDLPDSADSEGQDNLAHVYSSQAIANEADIKEDMPVGDIQVDSEDGPQN